MVYSVTMLTLYQHMDHLTDYWSVEGCRNDDGSAGVIPSVIGHGSSDSEGTVHLEEGHGLIDLHTLHHHDQAVIVLPGDGWCREACGRAAEHYIILHTGHID